MSDPPNKPRPPGTAIESVGPAKAPKRVDGPAEVGETAPTDPTGSAGAVASNADVAVARALSTGAVSSEQARAQLIDEVVRARLPPDADLELVEQVRTEVEALLADDPTLAALLDPKR